MKRTSHDVPMADALVLAQWLSPAYPVGAFAYSHGLETAIADGGIASAAAAGGWIDDVIRRGAGRSDAILLRLAHRGHETAPDHLDDLARAASASRERWIETRDQGAAFSRTTASVWGLDLPPCAYPVAVGRAAGLLGLDADLTAAFYLQAMASTLVSAAVRFVPLGQTEGQATLAALMRSVGDTAVATRGLGPEAIASCAFAGDIAAMRHETLEPRIFRT